MDCRFFYNSIFLFFKINFQLNPTFMKRFVYFFLALGFLSSCNDETDVLPSTDQQSTAVTTDFSPISEDNLHNKTNQVDYLSHHLAALNITNSTIENVNEFRST